MWALLSNCPVHFSLEDAKDLGLAFSTETHCFIIAPGNGN